MGKDRQEKKLKQSRRVESDRDQALHYDGATRLDTPEEARSLNDNKTDSL
ncbi:MAG: YpzI family protein [Bacillus sp. (in: firmicutes)]